MKNPKTLRTPTATRPSHPVGRKPSGRPGQKRANAKKKIAVIDLFCGAGGLTRGLMDAGLEVRLGIDLDKSCQYPYESNNAGAKFLLRDVAKLNPSELANAWMGADIRVLAGCAPCQPFSSYTQGRNWKHNDQWGLLLAFSHLVRKTKPDIVTMENVASLARHDVFLDFCKTLERQNYHVIWDVIDCRNFGIPQSRKRLVLIASRFGKPHLPSASHANPKKWNTVRRAIGKLHKLKSGESDSIDPIHVSSKLTLVNQKRIRASKPGGTWRDWPAELIAPCHTRKTGRTYPGVYGRMEWDAPSPTITGQCYGFGNGRFGHPSQNRGISLREAAILQTFPARYAFVRPGEPIYMSGIGQLIGNAVPPRLGQVIGNSIREHVVRTEH